MSRNFTVRICANGALISDVEFNIDSDDNEGNGRLISVIRILAAMKPLQWDRGN